MSIIKFINGKNRGAAALKNKIDYILDPEKTNRSISGGNGVELSNAYQDMATVQTLMGKESGRRFIHYVISFEAGIELDIAVGICMEIAEYFSEEYQFVWAIHTNTDNLHMHVVLNAVNMRTAKKFSQSKADLLAFRKHANKILASYEQNIIGKTQNSLYDEDYESYDYWNNEYDYCEDGYDENSYYEEEEERIIHAEQQDCLLRTAFDFFNGKSKIFPEELDYNEALEQYELWKENEEYDDDENTRIEKAKNQDVINAAIIAFFEGRKKCLPSGISYEEALCYYSEWREYVDRYEDQIEE